MNRCPWFVLVLFATFFLPVALFAQSSQSLSVSPTLFEMTANPAQRWASGLRIINPNPYEIKVYVDVVNFEPQNETGQPKFIPVSNDEAEGFTLAEWVDVNRGEIIVPAEQTKEVPFSIWVPEDASPGGHFAALMVGTKPPEDKAGVSQVQTSQVVTTLLFLRVTGDVIEDGNIRSFRPTEWFMERPDTTFELRFENKGNVHLQPQGGIKILNMWGQERGYIPVNQDTLFGNVLPNSIRKYTFSWKGDWSLADMGRYTAIATLAYGNENRQFTDSEVGFWVIPWKILLLVLLVLFGFITLFTWSVKLYIRKMLSMAGVAPGSQAYLVSQPRRRRVSVVAPIEEGMLDLRGHLEETTTWKERFTTLLQFVRRYKIFFIVLLAALLFIVGLFWYVQTASTPERSYEVTIDSADSDIHLSSDEVKYQQQKETSDRSVAVDQSLPKLTIVNRSGVPGLAADLRIRLESVGYEVLDTQTDLGVAEKNTVIVYDPEYTDQALELSQQVYGALLSAFEGASESGTPITIYVGQDLENAVE